MQAALSPCFTSEFTQLTLSGWLVEIFTRSSKQFTAAKRRCTILCGVTLFQATPRFYLAAVEKSTGDKIWEWPGNEAHLSASLVPRPVFCFWFPLAVIDGSRRAVTGTSGYRFEYYLHSSKFSHSIGLPFFSGRSCG